MVLSLAANALRIKCGFENARMTGNYECAYALGILSYQVGMEKPDKIENIKSMKEEVLAKAADFTTEDNKLVQMVHILKEYEPSDNFDSQMQELYFMGYDDEKL
jgi:hypothetical protein